MKLVHRVSVFFLAALAVVLAVYSSVFYVFVRARLVQQFEQELNGALTSLVAAVEVEPEEVNWQPSEHTISLGAFQEAGELQWAVIGDRSRVVEQSRHATPEFITLAKAFASRGPRSAESGKSITDSGWHILYQHLAAPAPDYTERELDEFDEILVMVADSATPLNADLHRLRLLVTVLPVGTWLVAAGVGHWFCRRALQPVLDMAQQARFMTGADFQSRLPAIATGDELESLAVAFNTLLDRQHRAFEQQRRFTGDAAHELRTPLTVLLGHIDVALRRLRSPQEYAATLRLLHDQTVQLQTIVESLLFLARAEGDAILPDVATFCLSAWLPEYMSRWNEHPSRNDIRLRVGHNGESPIKASPVLLARLLDNLIENALKYSSPGSIVEVTSASDDTGAIVEVRDHGMGIAAEDQAQVFSPFFRGRSARDAGVPGAGLGLAIAARIVAACGGHLDCSSELGRGSRFTLWLPIAKSGESDREHGTVEPLG